MKLETTAAMIPWERFSPAVLALILAVGSGCGDPVKALRELPCLDGVHWHAEPVDSIAPWGPNIHEPLFLIPEGFHTHGFRQSEFPALTVNLLTNGDVKFKGCTFKFRTGTGPEQKGARVALSNELARLVAWPGFVDEEGFSRVSFCIHGARETPWSSVRATVDLARGAQHPIQWLHWAVDNPVLAASQDASARMRPLGVDSSETTTGALSMRLIAHAANDGTGVRTHLEIDSKEWVFADQSSGFKDPLFLARANTVWTEAESWLAKAAQGMRSARIEIRDDQADLWWAYVVKTIDLLQGAGIRDVSFPDAELRLRLEKPDEIDVLDMEDEPVLTVWMIAGCFLAVLIAFAITFLPRARRRR